MARRYLFVDDNAAFAENLAEIVRDEGAEVEICPSPAAALERLRAERFDVVVTDMRMPLMSGAGLMAKLRKADPGLPALVVTAYTNDDDLRRARAEGVLAVLPKPVPVGQFLHLLSTARRRGLVAIVEDDAALSDNLAEALRDRGYTSVTAASVLETEGLAEVAPFAGLVDLRVPGGVAGEGMRRLAERFPGLPLVVVTAFADEPPLPHVAVFQKPFQTGALLDLLDRLHSDRSAA